MSTRNLSLVHVGDADREAPRWRQIRYVLRYFRKDVRKRRRTLAGGAAFGFVYALARVVEPWPLKVVFDQVLLGKPAHGAWMRVFTPFGTSPYALLAGAGAVLGVVGVLRGVAYFYEDFLLSRAAQQIVYAIRARLYRHLHRLPLSFHQERKTGDTLVRLSSDIVLLRDVLVDAIVNLGTGAILLVLMLAVMAAVDPILTGVSLVVMPVILVLTLRYGRRIRTNSQRQRKREGQVAAAMHEALSAIAVVQLHGAAEREQARFHEINRRSLKQGVAASRLEARMNRAVEMTVSGGLALMLSLGTLRVLHGALTPGELVVFISYLRGAYRPLQRASKTVQRGAKALAAAERVVEVLEQEPDLTDAEGARPAPPLTGRLSLEEVEFSYREGQPVLRGVDLDLEPGTTLALVGASGSGKSTLLSLIPRLYEASSGAVRVDGLDVRELTLESLRSQISLVLQDSVLFGLSIAENIRYGCPEATDEEIVAAAKAARIDEFVETLPEGYATVVSERGQSLSGGQRQRIALARALVRRTPILLLDEPTTGLDAATQREVVAVLRDELRSSTTTIVATHDPRLVREADEVALLEEGRIVARGGFDELRRSSATFRRLVNITPAGRTSAAHMSDAGDGRRVLFYSHNGVGVGHLQRQLDLARAYRARHPDSAVLLVTGSHGATMFDFPDGIDFLKLPSLQMVDRYRTWRPRDLPLAVEAVSALRAELLRESVRHFAPDLLVADFMPTGPYGELLPALDELDRVGGRAIAGFRDVVDEPEFVRALWRETGVYETLRDRYAGICVYGDRAMMDFERYGLGDGGSPPVDYCGYLGRPPFVGRSVESRVRPFVVATSGGGVDGAGLLTRFIEAAGRLQAERGGEWVAVAGPLMPALEQERLDALGRAAGVRVERSVRGLGALLAEADCVVAMAGYNTTCDVLSHRLPAVLVPRPGPSLEQSLRAHRLEQWGVARIRQARNLDGDALAAAITASLDGKAPEQAPVPLDGFERALEVFDRALRSAKAA